MLYFHMDEKAAEARIDAMQREAKERRRAERFRREHNFRFPKLSNLFKNWKSEKLTAVSR